MIGLSVSQASDAVQYVAEVFSRAAVDYKPSQFSEALRSRSKRPRRWREGVRRSVRERVK